MSTPVDIEPDEFYAVRHPLLAVAATFAALSTTFTSQADDGLDDTAPEAGS
ncbi:hypothetical protein [Kitasatospora sp. HPMI-4]|uniref:hypothetical protein n=1 Tax=Kitasatospora sp. HPMI-4 TaxID=3448443 RepID=UPI003F1A6DA3